MDAPALPLKGNFPNAGGRLNLIIEKGLQALLILTPLAFGTVHRWSQSLMEAAAFILLGAMLLRRSLGGDSLRLPKKLLIIPLALFALLAVIQILPLPEGLLAYISPKTAQVHRSFTGANSSGTMTISVNPGATLEELLKFLAYAAVFFVAIDYCRATEHINRLLRTVVYMGVGLVVFAIIQKMTWNGRLYWFYPLGENVPPGHDIWGPYINRNHFAGYMEMAIPIALSYVMFTLSTINISAEISFKKRILKIIRSSKLFPAVIFFMLALTMAAALFATFSRGGILGSTVSLVIFAVLAYKRKSLRKVLWISIALIGLILLIISAALLADIESRFMAHEASSSARLNIWIDSFKLLKDYPFFGTGLGTFNDAYMGYQTKWSAIFFEHAESDYLEILTEAGLFGILAVGATMTAFLYSVLAAWKRQSGSYAKCIGIGGLSAMSAMWIHAIGDFNLHIGANALTFTIIAAAACASAVTAARHGEAEPPPSAHLQAGLRRTALAALVIIFTLTLLYLPITGLLSEYYQAKAYRILDDKETDYLDQKAVSMDTLPDYTAAIRSLETAIALSPSRANYHSDLSGLHAKVANFLDYAEETAGAGANGLKKADSYKTAVSHMKEAIGLRPLNPYYHFTLGELYDETTASNGLAVKEFDAALSAFPINAPLRYSVTRHYLFSNRPEKAVKEAKILAAIDDTYVIADPEQWSRDRLVNSPGYREKLLQSYLAIAFDITWRASDYNLSAVKAIIPPPDTHPQADDVYQMFLEANELDD